MRKFSKVISLSLLILLVFSSIGFAQSHFDSKNSKEISAIKSKIENYISSKYECFEKGSVEPLKNQFKPEKLQEKKIKKELDLTQILLDWRIPRDLYYQNIKTDITFNDIIISGDVATVDIYEITSYNLKGHRVTSKEGNSHSISLEKTNGEWNVVSDSYNEPIGNMLDQGLSISDIKEKLFVDTIVSYNKTNEATILSGTYNRSLAVSYADQYWTNYNPAYTDFSGMGGDCTNFVSQCIRNGGAPDDTSGTQGSQWWYNLGTHARTPSWAGVDELYEYLMNNTNGGPKGTLTTNLYSVNLGDVIQIDRHSNGGDYTHTTIVTEIQYEDIPYLYVNAHSSNQYHYYYDNYPGDKRFIKISIR